MLETGYPATEKLDLRSEVGIDIGGRDTVDNKLNHVLFERGAVNSTLRTPCQEAILSDRRYFANGQI